MKDKISLKIGLEKNLSNSYIFLLDANFENLIIGLHDFYVLNTYVKFCSNWMLFTILSLNLFFMYNFKSQKLEI